MSDTLRFEIGFMNSSIAIRKELGGETSYPGYVLLDEYQTWRILIDHTVEAEAKCDIYLTDKYHDGSLIIQQADCDWEESSLYEGYFMIQQRGRTLNNVLSYLDYVKVDDKRVL